MERKTHSIEIRELCACKLTEGLLHAEIGRMLLVPVTSFKGIITRYKRFGQLSDRPRAGRPRITDQRADRCILSEAEDNRFVSEVALAAQLSQELSVNLGPQTVRNRLHQSGLRGRSARKKPFLTKEHKRKRLLYAKKMLAPFEGTAWGNILYSEEASIELHGASGNVFVWRRSSEAKKKFRSRRSSWISPRRALCSRWRTCTPCKSNTCCCASTLPP